MNRQQSFLDNDNALYIISTPIGNMKDITYRAVEVLKSVDYIYCEDTRVSVNLLKYYDINKPLKSYHEHNKNEKNHEILNDLNKGYNIGLISDAGTPIISDPGFELVNFIKENGFKVISIPGVTAFTTALTSSAMPVKPFLYYGFLNENHSKRLKELDSLKLYDCSIVIYESPHRIKDTLSDIFDVFGNIKISLCRELTKKFEEIINGNISEILEIVDSLKGEMVVIFKKEKEENNLLDLSIIDHVNLYVKNNYKVNDAIKMVAKERNMSKQDVYKEYHLNKE